MVREIRKQSKEGVGVSLAEVIKGFAKGVTGLLGFAANLEAEGKDEYVEQGEIVGRTKSGKEYSGKYGFRAKIGLSPEDFKVKIQENDDSKDGHSGQAVNDSELDQALADLNLGSLKGEETEEVKE